MKINILKFLPLLAVLLLAIPSCKSDDDEDQTMAVYSITLDKSALEITVGKTATLKATISPENATYKTVKWTSSDETIAKVDSKGIVTAVKEGTATITAASEKYSNKTASCTITVKAATTEPTENPEPSAVLVTTITLNKTTTEITVGNNETLTVTEVLPSNATDKTVTWSSADNAIATVDENGKVTAVAAGRVKITATANDGSGIKGECEVTVKAAVHTLTLSGQYWAHIFNETTHDLEDVEGDCSFTIEYDEDDTWGDIVAKYDWIYTTSYAYAPSGTIIHFTYSTDKGDIQAELKHHNCSSDTYNLVDIDSKVSDLAADGYFLENWKDKH